MSCAATVALAAALVSAAAAAAGPPSDWFVTRPGLFSLEDIRRRGAQSTASPPHPPADRRAGEPAYNGHTYGTILFSNRFGANHEITRGMLWYAVGYRRCLHRGSHAQIVLARGTSDYHPSVPSTFNAGRNWARETAVLARKLRRWRLDGHVGSAAAIDAEPAWDRGFGKTWNFFRGYRAGGHGHPLYNFGSLDGGVGAIWKTWQVYFVTAGMRDVQPIPEIYNRAMAAQWAYLAWLAKHRYHRRIPFAGVMMQHVDGCSCDYFPLKAHGALVRELAARRVEAAVPTTVTNIRSPQ